MRSSSSSTIDTQTDVSIDLVIHLLISAATSSSVSRGGRITDIDYDRRLAAELWARYPLSSETLYDPCLEGRALWSVHWGTDDEGREWQIGLYGEH